MILYLGLFTKFVIALSLISCFDCHNEWPHESDFRESGGGYIIHIWAREPDYHYRLWWCRECEHWEEMYDGVCPYETFMNSKGHKVSDCEWMVHDNPGVDFELE